MFKKNTLVIFAIFLIIASLYATKDVWAAPSISTVSGNVANGSSITISGSSFGTKSPAAPMIWANFERSAASVAAEPVSRVNLSSQNVALDTTSKPAWRSRCVKTTSNLNAYNASLYVDWLADLGSRNRYVYSYIRRKLTPANFFGTNNNQKFWRMYPTSGWGGNYFIDFVITIFNQNSGKSCYTWEGAGMTSGYNDANVYPTNEWFWEEIQVDKGTLNGANARFRHWVNGTDYGMVSGGNGLTTSYPNGFGTIVVDNQSAAGGLDPNATVYMADWYCDNTWQRIVIGNSPTYSSCTVREPQIPTAWSDSSITVTVNHGSFTSGTTVYLFVVDANGNANTPGYPVTIGAGTQAPTAPKGLRIVQ